VVATGTAAVTDQANHISGLPFGVMAGGVVIVAANPLCPFVINSQRATALANVAKEA